MKEFFKNPRKISKFELDRLKKNIIELGDLSGITHDLETDEIITGNQRVKALGLEGVDPVITKEFDEPDAQGTVKLGYFELKDGTTMSYRAVKWNEKQRDKANITANKLGGEWDWEMLNSDNWNKDILVDSGFDYLDFEQGKSNPNDDSDDASTSGKTKTTRFFTLEVLFPNKDDYVFVTEIIDKSKKKGETIAETLKRLLMKVDDKSKTGTKS